MKTLFKTFFAVSMLASAMLFVSGCDDDNDDPGPQLTGNNVTYNLSSVSNPAISGTVKFEERDDDFVVITIDLNGTSAGGTHPAHIHSSSAAEGGPIVLDLTAVDGATGVSQTAANTWNDGTPLVYDDLLTYDGHVNVHMSTSDLATLIAQGDIGGNELTGDNTVYEMIPVADPAVIGTTTFAKRKNGTTLVTVDLDGTQAGSTHPSHIHANYILQGGGIVIDLNPVDGATGIARTTVRELNDGTAITYDELIDFNGYVNVHAGPSFVAQVDIGQNALTGDKEEYTLNELNGSGVSGTAVFEKRKNGNTIITLSLQGTVEGGDHPAHIHANDAATGGGIVLDLDNVSGLTGKSVTNVNALKDATPVTYDELINYNGHINVHQSPTNLATRIAQGNIGSNVP
ncbi:MAG TPA: CHRD domain-containing protein [Chryseosolibacter sp.]|nr:CHRD domain-containing protein [Chryseosolibacter sp.]